MFLPESLKAVPQNKRDKKRKNRGYRRKDGGEEGIDYELPFATLGGTVVPKLRKAGLLPMSSYHSSSLEYGKTDNIR